MGKKIFTRNNIIVTIRVASACVLLFCCCFFFFQNIKMFGKDFRSFMFFSPVILLGGISFVCYYIVYLVFHLESNTTYLADRLELAYKIVYCLTFMMLITRAFFGDFMCLQEAGTACDPNIIVNSNDVPLCHNPRFLYVPVFLTITAIVCGLVTWLTPKIRDNDNLEF